MATTQSTTSSSTPKLEGRNVSMFYPKRGGGQIEVLHDVSFRIESGQFVSIVGASGCGKTTLLRIVDGLITPNSGEIRVDGARVVKPGRDRGFVFQQDALFPWRTVMDNVIFGPELQGRPRKESRARAADLLQVVGLRGFENHYPHELSGGMRQRANLARALTLDPDILLMDEPFAALDAQTREIMQAELLRIWRSYRKTVMFITHQIDEAVYLSDQVVVMTARPGRIKTIIDVDIPRPRDLSVKRTARFLELLDTIWKLIEMEVRASLDMVGTDATATESMAG